jgi:hypothetical protein
VCVFVLGQKLGVCSVIMRVGRCVRSIGHTERSASAHWRLPIDRALVFLSLWGLCECALPAGEILSASRRKEHALQLAAATAQKAREVRIKPTRNGCLKAGQMTEPVF